MKLASVNMPIKRKWLDMIADGKKRKEYRDASNRQVLRIYNWMANNRGWAQRSPTAIFRAGYRNDNPAIIVEIAGITLRGWRESEHPEWGEPVESRMVHFVIRLGAVIAQGTYSEIKSKILKAKGGTK